MSCWRSVLVLFFLAPCLFAHSVAAQPAGPEACMSEVKAKNPGKSDSSREITNGNMCCQITSALSSDLDRATADESGWRQCVANYSEGRTADGKTCVEKRMTTPPEIKLPPASQELATDVLQVMQRRLAEIKGFIARLPASCAMFGASPEPPVPPFVRLDGPFKACLQGVKSKNPGKDSQDPTVVAGFNCCGKLATLAEAVSRGREDVDDWSKCMKAYNDGRDASGAACIGVRRLDPMASSYFGPPSFETALAELEESKVRLRTAQNAFQEEVIQSGAACPFQP